MKEEKNEGVKQVEVTARAFVDALIDLAMEKNSAKIEEAYNKIMEEKKQREDEIMKKYKFQVPVN
jgi:Spy/CpxP family protein refolding chaperone